MKAWLGRIALLLVSVSLTLGVGELWFRLLSQESARVGPAGEVRARFNPYRADTELGYTLRPNWTAVHETQDFRVTVHTDARGLRSGSGAAVEGAPRGSEARRILLVGDSFAFGFGVEDSETFASVLERELAKSGQPVTIDNAGVPGFGIDHYYVVLRERLEELDPDLVLLASCSNDADELSFSRLELDESRLPLRTQSSLRMIDHRGRMRYLHDGRMAIPGWLIGGAWLADRSHFFNWVRYRLTRWWVSANLEREATSSGVTPEGSIEDLSQAEIQRALEQSSSFRWRFHEHVRAGIASALRARNVPLRTLHVGPDAEAMSLACRSEQASCLDLTSVFDASTHPEYFFPHDGHWTPAGHRAVAAALVPWLLPLLEETPEGDSDRTASDRSR